jgi:PAS domain S-box-containing protein
MHARPQHATPQCDPPDPVRPRGPGQTLDLQCERADRTEHQRTLDELAAAQQRLEVFFDNAPLAVVEFDPALRILRWSRGAERLFGWDAAEVLGRAIAELRWVHDEDAQAVGSLAAAMQDGTSPCTTSVNRNYCKDGRVVHCEWHNSAIYDTQGRLESILSQVLDITEREHALQALHEADRRKNAFLGTLAHELRNPLAPIRNAVEILRLKGPPDPTLQAARDMIDRQLGQLIRLIDDLLDLSRIDRGRLQLRRERVALATVLERALEATRPQLERAGHGLELSLPPEPVWLDADPARLTQVLVNLLDNACKYTEAGGRIRLCAELVGTELKVSVADDGIGIRPDRLSGLFQTFSQADATLERSQGGLGIGLALARGLVEMHGGSIAAQSAGPGQGSEFSVRLPTLPPIAPARAQHPQAQEDGKQPAGRRILVVDDNRDIVDSLAMLLRLVGNQVETAADGLEAVAAAERQRPDLILLDIGMPKLDGYAACRQIREQPWGQAMAIVALTGWGQEDDRRRSREAGFDGHLVKPVEPAALLKLLGEGLQQGPRA